MLKLGIHGDWIRGLRNSNTMVWAGDGDRLAIKSPFGCAASVQFGVEVNLLRGRVPSKDGVCPMQHEAIHLCGRIVPKVPENQIAVMGITLTEDGMPLSGIPGLELPIVFTKVSEANSGGG